MQQSALFTTINHIMNSVDRIQNFAVAKFV